MNIFQRVNSLSESDIAARLGLSKAVSKGYICPICGHGTHGDGIRQKTWKGNRCGEQTAWHCYGACGTHWRSNCDLIAEVEGISVDDAAGLAKRLEELFPAAATTSFPFQGKKKSPTAEKSEKESPEIKRNFSKFYEACRINYSLKEFVESCGGLYRGLTYETLKSARVLYHAEYMLTTEKKVPVLIFPYDEEFYSYRRVDEVPPDERKCGIPKGGCRKPYIAVPISLDAPNLIVEGEINALSIAQVWRVPLERHLPLSGVIATGSAGAWRTTVAYLERIFGKSERKPRFIVLFDNDEAGRKHGGALSDALNAAGFLTEQTYLGRVMKGEYVVGDVIKSFPKVDANDLLCDETLFERLIDVVDNADMWLGIRADNMRRNKK